MELITLRSDRGDLFVDGADAERFVRRAEVLGLRRGQRVVAWRIEPAKAELLMLGAGPIGEWLRLLRSGHALARGVPGGLCWAPARRQDMGLESGLAHLHALPFEPLDCSLWDGTRLRHRQLDVGLLRLKSPAWHFAIAGLSEPPRSPEAYPFVRWSRLLDVLRFVTGQPGSARSNSVLLTQLAVLVGWQNEAVAALRGVTPDAIRKALRQPLRVELEACLVWLFEPRFRPQRDSATIRQISVENSSFSTGSMGSELSRSIH